MVIRLTESLEAVARLLTEQSELLKTVLAQNERALAQRAAWEAVERAYMQQCERRYRALKDGETMESSPVRH